MRYQDDINTEHNIKSICRAALLNDIDNALDSELSGTGSSPLGEQQFLISTDYLISMFTLWVQK